MFHLPRPVVMTATARLVGGGLTGVVPGTTISE
jgi:hypothetical protein